MRERERERQEDREEEEEELERTQEKMVTLAIDVTYLMSPKNPLSSIRYP